MTSVKMVMVRMMVNWIAKLELEPSHHHPNSNPNPHIHPTPLTLTLKDCHEEDASASSWEDRHLEVRGFISLQALHIGSRFLDGSFLSKIHKHFLNLRQLSIHDSLDENTGPDVLLSIGQLANLQCLDVSFCQWLTDGLLQQYCQMASSSQKEELLLLQTIGCCKVSRDKNSLLVFETFLNLSHFVCDERDYVAPALASKKVELEKLKKRNWD
jgi:hypothetical protein